MKKNILLFFLFLLAGCSHNEEEMYNIETYVYYKLHSSLEEKFPDTGAKIYIYYDKQTSDFLHYKYEGEGILTKKDSVFGGDPIIKPDQIGQVDDTGSCIIKPKYTDKIVTVIIESHMYSPQIKWVDYPSISSPIKDTAIFEP